ncbi:MAG: ECF-type sigma factor [Planctomycetota bacterium]
MSDTPSDITLLLGKANRGDRGAFDQLVDVLYTDLRSRAEAYMRRERGDHTLQPTALVNEVYLRLLIRRSSSSAIAQSSSPSPRPPCVASWSSTRERRARSSVVVGRTGFRSTIT